MATPMRPGRCELCQAQDPVDAANAWTVYVERARLERLRDWNLYAFWNVRTAAAVLARPDRIFEDIGRQDRDGFGWCYAARPTLHYSPDGEDRPFPRGCVFAVYVRRDGTVFDWHKELFEHELYLPAKANLRYVRERWRRT